MPVAAGLVPLHELLEQIWESRRQSAELARTRRIDHERSLVAAQVWQSTARPPAAVHTDTRGSLAASPVDLESESGCMTLHRSQQRVFEGDGRCVGILARDP